MQQILVVLDHLAQHIKNDFLIFFGSFLVDNIIPGEIKRLYKAVFTQNFQQWPDLIRRDLIPADVERDD